MQTMSLNLVTILICGYLFSNALGSRLNQYKWDPYSHPPFLKNVSKEAATEYDKIISGKSKTLAKMREEASEWAKKYDIQILHHSYNEHVDLYLNKLNSDVKKALEEAHVLQKKFVKLISNMNNTIQQIEMGIVDMALHQGTATFTLLQTYGLLDELSLTPANIFEETHGHKPSSVGTTNKHN